MKKILVTIIAILYLGVTSGATVHLHYCMGELVDMGFVSSKTDKCGNCSMEGDATKNCCKHETKTAKVDKAQKVSDQGFQFKSFITEFKIAYQVFPEIYSITLGQDFPLINSPPARSDLPVFLQNCSFLI